MIKWGLFQECKDSSVYANQATWYTILTNWRRKPYDHLNRCRESFWQNSTPIYDKNFAESRHRGNFPLHNKDHIRQTHSQPRSQWWKTETISTKIRNKVRLPTLTTVIQHSFGSVSHSNQRRKRNKRIPNWKRSKAEAFLVAQWLRICLPMQGTWVQALVWEDPTCCGATGSVSQNYWACVSGACAPQQEMPR